MNKNNLAEAYGSAGTVCPILLRYWPGVMEVTALKLRTNMEGSRYPTCEAICFMGSFVLVSSSFALSIRRTVRYLAGLIPA